MTSSRASAISRDEHAAAAHDDAAATSASAAASSTTTSGHAILVQLIALTPLPPPDAAPELLLATFEAILEHRAALVANVVPPLAIDDADREMLRELEHRHEVWHDALAKAQRHVLESRHANQQLRAYAPRF